LVKHPIPRDKKSYNYVKIQRFDSSFLLKKLAFCKII